MARENFPEEGSSDLGNFLGREGQEGELRRQREGVTETVQLPGESPECWMVWNVRGVWAMPIRGRTCQARELAPALETMAGLKRGRPWSKLTFMPMVPNGRWLELGGLEGEARKTVNMPIVA